MEFAMRERWRERISATMKQLRRWGASLSVFQGRWPWVVGEMGVAVGVAMPMNSVREL